MAYTTIVIESGATVKEAQALARHSTPVLTMNTYARARNERLAEVAEAVGKVVNIGPNDDYVPSMHGKAAGAESVDVKACDALALQMSGNRKTSAFESPRVRHFPDQADLSARRAASPSQIKLCSSEGKPPIRIGHCAC